MDEHYLFSYGTLQDEEIQMELYGTVLLGIEDAIKGFVLKSITLTDQFGNKKDYLIGDYSGRKDDIVKGIVYSISEGQLALTDFYEGPSYKRISVVSENGRECWLYVEP